MTLVNNAIGKMQEKIALGVIFIAGIASIVTCTLFFYEEEVPKEIQANLSQFK
ncbi:cyclic lactone autoinducer peptide [Paenibacillus endoradicis]|uniref:cyclic lactone autoinducer peptide n=1 Tax=Paenibacillus endoradicis TaxID=2972487 RepID=UPI0021599B11|nr:cyclic lactone autoinducer peptide [Paenibacillus endoradicis]MCR8659932.1 cyclic lactone autoinducer peptide [Paenibacillus endoradicis]